ncbi:hypothetical protein EVA_10439 [gut metagenome]|uniref:Uncharacterized protein n=1 Tax=gut metagenome TaxID=749906 RepID=J9CMW1_9ZZZZ
MADTEVAFHSLDSVAHQHGNGHGADAARDRRDGTGHCFDGFGIDVTAEFAVFITVDADVDHDSAFFHHIGRNHAGSAYSCNQNISLTSKAGDVRRVAVHNGDRGIFFQKHQGLGFADNIGAAENDGVFAFRVAAGFFQERHDAVGRTGTKARAARQQFAG